MVRPVLCHHNKQYIEGGIVRMKSGWGYLNGKSELRKSRYNRMGNRMRRSVFLRKTSLIPKKEFIMQKRLRHYVKDSQPRASHSPWALCWAPSSLCLLGQRTPPPPALRSAIDSTALGHWRTFWSPKFSGSLEFQINSVRMFTGFSNVASLYKSNKGCTLYFWQKP